MYMIKNMLSTMIILIIIVVIVVIVTLIRILEIRRREGAVDLRRHEILERNQHLSLSLSLSLYIYIYIYTYTYMYAHVYIYIYICGPAEARGPQAAPQPRGDTYVYIMYV